MKVEVWVREEVRGVGVQGEVWREGGGAGGGGDLDAQEQPASFRDNDGRSPADFEYS